ncbi:MAG: GTP-binding protein [Candidatus Saccharibacteria bacterium]|nr:GTP-binding protein [Candidatus Saccharibacteria bacterium]
MKSLNLGILAHVDAGKTSLTERLLYTAGVIDEIGSVDAGSTQTDSLQLERQRGITIKSAVASFVFNDTKINLIDTPGHPDFIAEVERVLSVLDGVVLVISAVEGVQAQTRVLMRALQRLEIPTLIFVNKIDRRGAQYERVLTEIAEKLSLPVTPMGSMHELGTSAADFTAFDTPNISPVQSQAYPVFFGSAITGAGIGSLITGITELLPATEGNAAAPVSGSVFKIERGAKGEKIAYVSLTSGTIHVRKHLQFGQGKDGKVTVIDVFDHGKTIQRTSMAAGEIGKLRGLADVKIGDAVGKMSTDSQRYFAPPTLETVVLSRNSADKGKLRVALDQLAEQDPLINVRQDDIRQEIYVSLYGEVQKQVIEATLASDYGIHVNFLETTPICIERPLGTGEAVEFLGKNDNPFLATLGLRVDPAPVGSGLQLKLDARLESLPIYIYKSVPEFKESLEQYVAHTLREGLSGWQVVDTLVTLTECGYEAPGSTAGDFRKLTPLVLMSALKQAGTIVCEPICRFELEIPANALSLVLSALGKLGTVPQTTTTRNTSYILSGDIPSAQVHELQQRLPAMTSGEGVLEYEFDRYEPVRRPKA